MEQKAPLTVKLPIMKTHLPKKLLVALLAAMTTGALHAAPVTPQDGEIVTTKENFSNATTGNIFYDGDTIEITEDISKGNLYVRNGEIKFSAGSAEDATAPIITLGNIAVAGNNAVMTFDKANYSSTAALNHVGGVDGNGILNITNGSDFNSDAEVFTIGVQGTQAGNGSEGSAYTNGSYDDEGRGRGDVNITDSTAKLTYRHLQMGEGSLKVDNSTVTVGNKNGGSEYYKGFKATLGTGENTTSDINVTNGGQLSIYASANDNYLGGFSTNYSDGSTANITVDNATLSVANPVHANADKYPEGRAGDTYIGFSFMGELEEYTKNATTNISIKNGGTVNLENHTTHFGYAGMKENGTSVNVTLHDEDSTLNVNSKDIDINEGVTIENKGTINIDTTYALNRMANGELAMSENPVDMYGGSLNNHEGAKINVENDFTVGGAPYGSSEQKAVITNEGDISAREITFDSGSDVTNKGVIATTSGDIYVEGTAKLTNSGTLAGYLNISGDATVSNTGSVDATTYMHGSGAIFNAGDGSTMKRVYLNSGTFNVEGTVTLNSAFTSYYPSEASLVFSEGATLNMQDYTATLDGLTIKLTENGSRTSAVVSLGANGSCSVGEDAAVVLSLADSYLDKLSDAASSVSILFADKEASSTEASITVNESSDILWDIDEESFAWETKDGKTYITGTVNAVTEIQVTEEGELSESITDVADGTQRSVNVKGTVATLSGDNSHTGGTTIDNASLTLSSATAAGKGGITTTGNAGITTAEDVTAELYQPIQNKDGVLTLTGSYDVSALTPDTINETWLDAQLNEGENGFYRHEGSSIQVVENENATIAEISDPSLTHDNGLSYTLDTATGIAVAGGETKWDTYYINTEDHTGTVSEMMTASNNRLEQVEMKAGVLNADASAKVNATGGSIFMTGQDVNLTGTLSGDTHVLVLGTGTITGDNTHTGNTVIAGENAKLTVGSATALGAGTVTLQDHGTLDLNGMAVSNAINVTGCTISRAGNYDGSMEVSGKLTLTDATTAKEVIIRGGSIEGASLRTTRLEVSGEQDGQITSDVTIADQGSIVLNNGAQLNITGSLTLGQGTTLTLAGDGYEAGSIPITWTGTLTGDTSALTLNMNGDYELVQDGDRLVLVEKTTEGEPEEDKPIVEPEEDEPTEEPEEDAPIVEPEAPVAPVFDQATADALAQANWGVYTASRAFVGAVQGQRNNTGCIANGRGTAWGALLGATNSIDSNGIAGGSDTTLYGAAIGVDMKLGKRSVLGVAFGYTDAKVSADGLGDIDQEGGHIALYGEHGLKKFANNSCLSLDWVAATGTTESSYRGSDWEQDHLQLNTRVTWNKKVTERFAYNVFGGLEYFASESDRVQNCKTGSVQNLRGELGLGARYVVKKSGADVYDGKAGLCPAAPACERVVVYGEISYINDMVRNNPSIEVGGLRGSGANPGRQGVGIEAGATFRIGERWSANANYSFNAMDDANEHSLNLGASRTF